MNEQEQKPVEELTPEQRVKLARSEAKRKRWANILCQNALDATSLKLAERLTKDWFQCGCDELRSN